MNEQSVNINNVQSSELTALRYELRAMSEALLSRKALAGYLGYSFDGDRDLYTACGYPVTLTYNKFLARYIRQDIGKRIVRAYPDACWRLLPTVYDDENPDITTPFEQAWSDLVKIKKIFHYLKRADRIAGIGQYSVILLGFNDGRKLEEEVVSGKRQLLYLRPYSQGNASIEEWEENTGSERYGLPKIYGIKAATLDRAGQVEERVHYSRILHIAEDPIEDDVYGTPRLEDIFNRLQDIETIVAGSAEMFWEGAFPGFAFKAAPDTDFTQTTTDLKAEIENYVHKLRRYMKLQGLEVQQLNPQVVDPTPAVMIQLKIISGAKGIPIRILIGSERGELSSTQDDDNWIDRIEERRVDFAESFILRPFIDKLIKVGVLPQPKSGEYMVDWPDLRTQSDIQKADVAIKRMQALQAYMNSLGADQVYPKDKFLENEMGLSPKEIQDINDQIESDMLQDEEDEVIDEEVEDNENAGMVD